MSIMPVETALDLSFVNVNPATGSVVVNDVVSCLQANTCLVSIMLANNETGIIQVMVEKLIIYGR